MPYALIKIRTQLTAFYNNPRKQATLKIANTQKIPPLKSPLNTLGGELKIEFTSKYKIIAQPANPKTGFSKK